MNKGKNIVLMLLCSLWLGCFATAGHATPMVTLQLSKTDITVGETFNLEVYFDGLDEFDEVLGFDFDLDSYDSDAFSYISAEVDSSSFDDSSDPTNYHNVAGWTFPGITGDSIRLASLKFTANQAGDFSLGIVSAEATKGLATLSQFLEDGPLFNMTSTINVTVAPVPEPTITVLFSIGCAAGLFILRKRKSSAKNA